MISLQEYLKSYTDYNSCDFIYLNEIDSTQLEAKRLIDREIFVPRTCIIAKSQTCGRGRMDRKWVSSEGNLHLTLILNRTDSVDVEVYLPLITSLAIYHTILNANKNITIQLKWPNDVLISSQKVAGCLIEKVGKYILVGIGVNVKTSPEETTFDATHLNKYGIFTPLEILADEIIRNINAHLSYCIQFGFLGLRGCFLKNAYKLGEKLKVGGFEGIFQDINDSGNIILRCADGLKCISFGDVEA